MTTWTNSTKNTLSSNDYRLNIGSGFNLLVATGYELLITPLATGGWTNVAKNTASYSNVAKNAPSWTNITKN